MRRARRRLTRFLAAMLALVAIGWSATACSGDYPTQGTWSIAGPWSGTAALGTVHFSATFTQSGEDVGGSGNFTSPLGSGPFTITGKVVVRDVNLVLTSAEFGTSGYIGQFRSATRITGRLTAPQFSDLALTLEKQ